MTQKTIKTKVLGFIAGPGAGKTTMSFDVCARLKHAGYNIELVREYAKELVWEYGEIPSHITQADIIKEQDRRQRILMGKVDLIVTDSPLCIAQMYGSDPEEIARLMNDYDNYHIRVDRRKGYNPSGRYQTEDEAKDLDSVSEQFKCDRTFPGTELGGKWAYDYAVDIIKGKLR